MLQFLFTNASFEVAPHLDKTIAALDFTLLLKSSRLISQRHHSFGLDTIQAKSPYIMSLLSNMSRKNGGEMIG